MSEVGVHEDLGGKDTYPLITQAAVYQRRSKNNVE